MISVQTIANLQTVFHSCTGRRLTDVEAKAVARGFISFRDTRKALISSPDRLFRAAFENATFYNKAVYPCDVIELRNILEGQKITSQISVAMWSLLTARKIFRDYSCYIVIDFDTKDCECIEAGGMIVCQDPYLDIRGKLKGIIVNGHAPFETIERIIADTVPGIPIYGEAYVPGLDAKKFASIQGLTKYIVNLPTLGINNEMASGINEQEAVAKALSRRWLKLPDSKSQPKPARYTPEFWLESGFWNTIVREASMNSEIKTAAATVQLTPEEEQVFNIILSIDKQYGLGQQYRVAGGWVRDRLLGTQSDDIDIALDKMTGQQFLRYAEEYKRMHPDLPIGNNYVVSANDAKSKHLETTALEIGPFKIDFVNLRSEDYASDSRVPEMKFGTPETDAQRRDLTINSLFYNIGTRQIEDYVGGMQDLQQMILRTPLDPVQTFMDDPLRILRVLRFNSRYPNAKMAPEVLQAMSNPQVHESYRVKVSPERAGPEILKLFSGEKPVDSLAALYNTGMDSAIFNIPEFSTLNPFDMNQRNPNHEFTVKEHTFRVLDEYNKILKQQEQAGAISKKDRMLGLIASWFHDYGKLHPEIGKPKESNPEHYSYVGHEDVSADLAEIFLKQIGIGKNDREFVTTIVREHMLPHNHGNNPWNKRRMGKLREKSTIPGQERNDVWKFIMWHAKADDAGKSTELDPAAQAEYDEKYQMTNDYMNAPPPIQPLVDGRRLIELFPNISPKTGFIKEIQRMLLDEQNAGNILDVSQAEQFVQNIRPQIEGKYVMQQPQPPMNPPSQASNWYSLMKEADASSGTGPEGFNAGPDSNPAKEKWEDVQQMVYYSPGGNNSWSKGDKVRQRGKGLAFVAQEGKVVDKQGDKIIVHWNNGKKEAFNTDNAETMIRIERV